VKSIKTLGIAVLAALALTAVVGVASASATEFHSESESTTWKGARTGANHVLKLGNESFSCKNVSFSGTTVLQNSKQFTVTPELTGCTWGAGFAGTWVMHSCKFLVHSGPSSAEPLVGWIDIVGCEKAMDFNSTNCHLEIGNQKNIGTLEYQNASTEGFKTVTMVANFSGITYTRNPAVGCFNGGPGTFTDGTYTGEWTVKGFAKTGTQTNVSVTPSGPGTFLAEEAPATITGKRTPAKASVFYLPGIGPISVSCNEQTLSGTMAAVSQGTIALTPTYGKCSFVGQLFPMNMGGCSYVLHASKGAFDIVGATCASSPITIVLANCTATIGPQSGLPGLSYSNEGSGTLRNVVQAGEAVGLKYTTSGKGCTATGTFTDGAYNGADTFTATNAGGKQQGLSVE
jgi:hypothetical protein